MPDIYIAPKKIAKKKASSKKNLRLDKVLAEVNLKPSFHPLNPFLFRPDKINFETQEPDEQIILFLRQHWITNVPWIGLTILMLFIPLVLIILPLLSSLPSRYQLVSVVIWYLIVLGFVFEKFLSWFFNIFIVTDQRVIDIDFYSLVYREISQADLDKIQDMSYKTGGLIKGIFNYGDVLIQTAAEVQKIEFESVPQPAKVVEIINHLVLEGEGKIS